MSTFTQASEQTRASRAGRYLAVQDDEDVGLVPSGMVGSEEPRQAALEIARELAGA